MEKGLTVGALLAAIDYVDTDGTVPEIQSDTLEEIQVIRDVQMGFGRYGRGVLKSAVTLMNVAHGSRNVMTNSALRSALLGLVNHGHASFATPVVINTHSWLKFHSAVALTPNGVSTLGLCFE